MPMSTGDFADSTVNPQAGHPGNVKPERTPGSAPSVVPLPAGADPNADPGAHPLPEDAIEGYPNVEDLYKDAGGLQPQADGTDPVPADPPRGTNLDVAKTAKADAKSLDTKTAK
jgi:hypothetical protein